MTASFVQVRPMGIVFTSPSPQPRDSAQVLRARRCLFGPSDPAETARLLRDEERASLEYLQQTYQIIDIIGDSENISVSRESTNLIRNGESEVIENRASNLGQEQPAKNTDSSSAGKSLRLRRFQHNPGPLKTFPIRKHPYALMAKPIGHNALTGNAVQHAQEHTHI